MGQIESVGYDLWDREGMDEMGSVGWGQDRWDETFGRGWMKWMGFMRWDGWDEKVGMGGIYRLGAGWI